MPRILSSEVELFSAKAATGVSEVLDVRNYRHIVVAVTATVNSTLTFKFQGSSRDSQPTFSSAQAVLNVWDYVAAYDLNDPNTIITGDTGVSLNNAAVAVNTRLYLVNVDHLSWFSMEVTAYTDGALSAWASCAND